MPSKSMSARETMVEKMWECIISVTEAYVFLAGPVCASVHN